MFNFKQRVTKSLPQGWLETVNKALRYSTYKQLKTSLNTEDRFVIYMYSEKTICKMQMFPSLFKRAVFVFKIVFRMNFIQLF